MARSKDECAENEGNGEKHDSAEQKENGRNHGHGDGAKQRVVSEKDCPNREIESEQATVHNQVDLQRRFKEKTEPREGRIKNHKPETGKASDVFRSFKEGIPIEGRFVCFCEIDNVRYHEKKDDAESVRIEPAHFVSVSTGVSVSTVVFVSTERMFSMGRRTCLEIVFFLLIKVACVRTYVSSKSRTLKESSDSV